MKRLEKLAGSVCFALMFAMSSPAAAVNYQDWWLNPSIIGAGVNIGQQGNVIAAAWYLFDGNGHPTFLTFAGQLVGNQVSGDLYRTEVSGGVATNSVGSATFTFTSDSTAVLNYNYDGHAGSINLERFTFATFGSSPAYSVSVVVTRSGCTTPSFNGNYVDWPDLTVTRIGNSWDLLYEGLEVTCNLSATASQAGSIYQGSGSFNCNDGTSGTLFLRDIRISPEYLYTKIKMQFNVGETCLLEGSMSGPAYDSSCAGCWDY
jgi:hypothetical protein